MKESIRKSRWDLNDLNSRMEGTISTQEQESKTSTKTRSEEKGVYVAGMLKMGEKKLFIVVCRRIERGRGERGSFFNFLLLLLLAETLGGVRDLGTIEMHGQTYSCSICMLSFFYPCPEYRTGSG